MIYLSKSLKLKNNNYWDLSSIAWRPKLVTTITPTQNNWTGISISSKSAFVIIVYSNNSKSNQFKVIPKSLLQQIDPSSPLRIYDGDNIVCQLAWSGDFVLYPWTLGYTYKIYEI